MIQDYLKTFMISGLIALGTTPIYIAFARKRGILDKPAARKIHRQAMPTAGGVIIWIAFLMGVLFAFSTAPFFMEPFAYRFAGITVGSFIIILAGFYDDIKGINPKAKLTFQIFAAIALMAYGFIIEEITNPFGAGKLALGIFSVPVTLIWIVGIINAINLSDGLDGLAAGISGIASIFIFVAALRGGNFVLAFLAVTLVGATLGFLPYNFSPAKVFMGDTGSMFLGFMLSAIAIEGSQKSTAVVTLLIPIITLAVPIMDTALSIFRRIIKKSKVFTADKEHIHHKLLSMKQESQRKVVLSLYFLTACFGFIALSFQDLRGFYGVLALVIVGMLTYRWLKNFGFLEFRR